MNRRKFIKETGMMTAGASVIAGASTTYTSESYQWRMVTTWPKYSGSQQAVIRLAVVKEIAAKVPFTQKVYNSYEAFLKQSIAWDQIR